MAADRYADQFKAGLDIRNITAVAEGPPALASAVLQSGLAQDPAWFTREPGAAGFWLAVAGLDPDAFADQLARWQAGQPVA